MQSKTIKMQRCSRGDVPTRMAWIKQTGREAEKAVAEMMQANERVVKLGFNAQDANWRNIINCALLKNGDAARRRRKALDQQEEDSIAAVGKPMAKLTLTTPPRDKPSWEIFDL